MRGQPRRESLAQPKRHRRPVAAQAVGRVHRGRIGAETVPTSQERRQIADRARFETGAGGGALEADERFQVLRVAIPLGIRAREQPPLHQPPVLHQLGENAGHIVKGQQFGQLLRGARAIELQQLGCLIERRLAERGLRMNEMDAAGALQSQQPAWNGHARKPLSDRQGHPIPHPLAQFVLASRRVAGAQALRPRLEIRNHRGVDGRPQTLVEHGLGNEVVAQRRRPGAVRERRVVGVHVAADLLKSDAGGERTRHRGGSHRPRQIAGGDPLQRPPRRREIELVHKTGAPSLQQDGEVRQRPSGREQLFRLQARHPQRHALVEAALGDEQRPPGALAKAGAEEPRRLQRLPQQRLEVRRRHQIEQPRRVEVRRNLRHDDVVVRMHIRLGGEPLAPSGAQRERQRLVHAPAPERVQHHLALPLRARMSTGA